MYYFVMLSAILLLLIKLKGGKYIFQYIKYNLYFQLFQNKLSPSQINPDDYKKAKSLIISMADGHEIIYKSRKLCKNSVCLSHSQFLNGFLMPRSCNIHSRFGRLLLFILLLWAQVWSREPLALPWNPVWLVWQHFPFLNVYLISTFKKSLQYTVVVGSRRMDN